MKNNLRPTQQPASAHETADRPDRTVEPSWFIDPANEDLREDLIARYRQARIPVDPSPQQFAGAPSQYWEPQDWIETRPYPHTSPPQKYPDQEAIRPKPHTHRSRIERGLPATFLLAAVIAALSGAGAGFINAKIEPVTHRLTALTSSLTPSASNARRPQPLTETVISKKPVAIATLDVQDVSGETNSLIPLALHAEPALAGQDLMLRISGLPEKAYLTSGRKTDQVWTLALGDLKDLKLVMPDDSSRQIDVAVAAVERRTGQLAAPVKSMTIALSDAVVQPVSAPPPGFTPIEAVHKSPEKQLSAIPSPTTIGTTERSDLGAAKQKVSLGDGLVKKVHLTLARKAYREAWELGSADGAFGLARSYDPDVLKSMKIKQAHANIATALLWYERAATAGKIEARKAVARLKQ